jgi:hypothetical protein
MERVNELHRITAIAGPAQENLDFYARGEGRFGQTFISSGDPHGLRVALVEPDSARRSVPCDENPLPLDVHPLVR